jgi:DNA-binding IclR family transcriptional regulator
LTLGYAARDEDDQPGVQAIAAPIFHRRGSVVAAIDLRGTRLQVRKKDIPLMAGRVAKAAQDISRSLGDSECPS